MPEISRFLGIVFKMFFDDHNPPQFHAEFGEDVAREMSISFAILLYC
jgi:hypothetical protein